MITHDVARRFAHRWLDAWNSRDLDAILSHYADDVEWESPFIAHLGADSDGKLRGKASVRGYLARGLRAYPDLRFRLLAVFVGVGSLVIHYESVNYMLAAEVFEFDSDDRVSRVVCHYTTPEPAE